MTHTHTWSTATSGPLMIPITMGGSEEVPPSQHSNGRPTEAATLEECWEYLFKHPDSINHIPRVHRTNDMFQYVISCGHFTAILDTELEKEMTKELYLAIILESPNVLKLIPRDHITQLMCNVSITTVQSYTYAHPYHITEIFSHVPDEYKTAQLCEMVYRTNPGLVVQFPLHHTTSQLWLDAFERKAIGLAAIPESMMHSEIYYAAITRGFRLHDVPIRFRTKKLCDLAVARDGAALEHVPLELKTQDLCESAIRRNCEAILHVPVQTRGLCNSAARENVSTIALLDAEAQTEELLRLVITPETIQSFRLDAVHNQTPKVCAAVVGLSPMQIQYVRHQTDELCRIAVNGDALSLQYVRNQTEEICELAIRKDTRAFMYVRNKTHRICEIAIILGCDLGWVPWTTELLAVAVEQKPISIMTYVQQTPQMCLGAYRRKRSVFESILDEDNRVHVVQVTLTDKVSVLRPLNMSAALLSEIIAVLDGADLFPRQSSARDRITGRDSHLSRKRRWDVAACVKHWTPMT